MNSIPHTLEKHTSKLPAILLLHNLGWQYLSPKQALAYREGKVVNVVLDVVLREVLSQRTISYLGQERALSAKAVDNLVAELTSPKLNESLVGANEHFYNHLLYGITVTEFIDGKKISCTVPIIDWETSKNNQFHFTEEFSVANANGSSVRTPDLVCFVNGLPLVVIEAKRPDGKTEYQTWNDTKTRNEADKIRSRIARSLEIDFDNDPYAKARFSGLLQQAIEEAEALFDHPIKQYLLFKEFEEQMAERKLPDIPDRFGDNYAAQAYFGVFKTVLPETLSQGEDFWVDLAFEIDQAVLRCLSEHSINLEQVEKDIRKQLLPMIFKICQANGSGMLQAKEIVERIVQIVRVGRSNG